MKRNMEATESISEPTEYAGEADTELAKAMRYITSYLSIYLSIDESFLEHKLSSEERLLHSLLFGDDGRGIVFISYSESVIPTSGTQIALHMTLEDVPEKAEGIVVFLSIERRLNVDEKRYALIPFPCGKGLSLQDTSMKILSKCISPLIKQQLDNEHTDEKVQLSLNDVLNGIDGVCSSLQQSESTTTVKHAIFAVSMSLNKVLKYAGTDAENWKIAIPNKAMLEDIKNNVVDWAAEIARLIGMYKSRIGCNSESEPSEISDYIDHDGGSPKRMSEVTMSTTVMLPQEATKITNGDFEKDTYDLKSDSLLFLSESVINCHETVDIAEEVEFWVNYENALIDLINKIGSEFFENTLSLLAFNDINVENIYCFTDAIEVAAEVLEYVENINLLMKQFPAEACKYVDTTEGLEFAICMLLKHIRKARYVKHYSNAKFNSIIGVLTNDILVASYKIFYKAIQPSGTRRKICSSMKSLLHQLDSWVEGLSNINRKLGEDLHATLVISRKGTISLVDEFKRMIYKFNDCKKEQVNLASDVVLFSEIKIKFAAMIPGVSYIDTTCNQPKSGPFYVMNSIYDCFLSSVVSGAPQSTCFLDHLNHVSSCIRLYLLQLEELQSYLCEAICDLTSTITSLDGVHEMLLAINKLTLLCNRMKTPNNAFINVVKTLCEEIKLLQVIDEDHKPQERDQFYHISIYGIAREELHKQCTLSKIKTMVKIVRLIMNITSNKRLSRVKKELKRLWLNMGATSGPLPAEYEMDLEQKVAFPNESKEDIRVMTFLDPFSCSVDAVVRCISAYYFDIRHRKVMYGSITRDLPLVVLMRSFWESFDSISASFSKLPEEVKNCVGMNSSPFHDIGHTTWEQLKGAAAISGLFNEYNAAYICYEQAMILTHLGEGITNHLSAMTTLDTYRGLSRLLAQIPSFENAFGEHWRRIIIPYLHRSVTSIINKWRSELVHSLQGHHWFSRLLPDGLQVVLSISDTHLYLCPPLEEIQRYLGDRLREELTLPQCIEDQMGKLGLTVSGSVSAQMEVDLEAVRNAIDSLVTKLNETVEHLNQMDIVCVSRVKELLDKNTPKDVILTEFDDIIEDIVLKSTIQLDGIHLMVSEDCIKKKRMLAKVAVASTLYECVFRSSTDLYNVLCNIMLHFSQVYESDSHDKDISNSCFYLDSPNDEPNDRVHSLQQPYEETLEGLRDEMAENLMHSMESPEVENLLMNTLRSLDRVLKPLNDTMYAKNRLRISYNDWKSVIMDMELIETRYSCLKRDLPLNWISSSTMRRHLQAAVTKVNSPHVELPSSIVEYLHDLLGHYERLLAMVKLEWNKAKDAIENNIVEYDCVLSLIATIKMKNEMITKHMAYMKNILEANTSGRTASLQGEKSVVQDLLWQEMSDYCSQWQCISSVMQEYHDLLGTQLTTESVSSVRSKLRELLPSIQNQSLVWRSVKCEVCKLQSLMKRNTLHWFCDQGFVRRLVSITEERSTYKIVADDCILTVKQCLALLTEFHDEIHGIISHMEFQRVAKEYIEDMEAKWASMCAIWTDENISNSDIEENDGFSLKIWSMTNLCIAVNFFHESTAVLNSYLTLKHSDDLKNVLEQWSSKFAATFKCIELWHKVETRLLSMAMVFVSSSVRQQLQKQCGLLKVLLEDQEALVMSTSHLHNFEDKSDLLFSMDKNLDTLEGLLKEYLEEQRFVCPRFFFLRDEDLIQIIGQVNIKKVEMHIQTMFPGVQKLRVSHGKVKGLVSKEGSVMPFLKGISIEHIDSKELVMSIEKQMKRTVRSQIVDSVNILNSIYSQKTFSPQTYAKWVASYTSQVLILALSVLWTKSMEDARDNEDINLILSTLGTLTEATSHLAGLRYSPGLKVKQISIILIYQLYKTKGLGIVRHNSYKWERCIRYYMVKGDLVELHLGSHTYPYGYEYLGAGQELILTALTERCFVGISEAMKCNVIANPQGPAGTGKTESVKALANLCGYPFLVFNCSEELNYLAMEQTFAGLCQMGAWGIFDELNRLTEGALSAIADRIQEIISCRRNRNTEIALVGRKVHFNKNVALFVTINPDYLSRSTFPLNMKMICRPILMEQVDLIEVIQVELEVSGIKDAKSISMMLYNVLRCLSICFSEVVYDFGLRCAKSVISFLRESLVTSEECDATRSTFHPCKTLEKALISVIRPRLPLHQLSTFQLIVQSCVGNHITSSLDKSGISTIASELQSNDFLESKLHNELDESYMKRKTEELKQFIGKYKGIILQGAPGSGKSACIAQVVDSLAVEEGVQYSVVRFDPNSVEPGDLYGKTVNGEWEDGLFTWLVRRYVSSGSKVVIVLDGDLHSSWIENLNSVLDDNTVLTLSNRDRIQVGEHITFIFETECLDHLTMATISRCALVRFETMQQNPYVGKYIEYFQLVEGDVVCERLGLLRSLHKGGDDMNNFLFSFINAFGSHLSSAGYDELISKVDDITRKNAKKYISYMEAEAETLATTGLTKIAHLVCSLVSSMTPFVFQTNGFPPGDKVVEDLVASLSECFTVTLYLTKRSTHRVILDVLLQNCSLKQLNSGYIMSPHNRKGEQRKLVFVVKDIEAQSLSQGCNPIFFSYIGQLLQHGSFYMRKVEDEKWIHVQLERVTFVFTTTTRAILHLPQRLKRLIPTINGEHYLKREHLLNHSPSFILEIASEESLANLGNQEVNIMDQLIKWIQEKDLLLSTQELLYMGSIIKCNIPLGDRVRSCQMVMKYRYGLSVDTAEYYKSHGFTDYHRLYVPWLEETLHLASAIRDISLFINSFCMSQSNLLCITGGDTVLKTNIVDTVVKQEGYVFVPVERSTWPQGIIELLARVVTKSERFCLFIDWELLSLQSPDILCHIKNLMLRPANSSLLTQEFWMEIQNRDHPDKTMEQIKSIVRLKMDCNIKFIVSSHWNHFDRSLLITGLHFQMPRPSSLMNDMVNKMLSGNYTVILRRIYDMYICFCRGEHKFCDYALLVRITKDLISMREEEYKRNYDHFVSGMEKIEVVKEGVLSMKEMLDARRALLVSKNEEASSKYEGLSKLREIAVEKRQAAENLSNRLKSEKSTLEARSEDVKSHLEQVLPLLELSRKEVESINRKSLDELRSMVNPPSVIKYTVETVVILLNNSSKQELSWGECRKALKGTDFIFKILNFDVKLAADTTLKLVTTRLSGKAWDVSRIQKASKAAGPLAKWVVSIIKYAEIKSDIQPLIDEVETLKEFHRQNEVMLSEQSALVEDLGHQLQKYEREYNEINTSIQLVQSEVETASMMLAKSAKLISNLSAEVCHWQQSITSLESNRNFEEGDAIIEAVMTSFAGSLGDEGREELYRRTAKTLSDMNIQYKYDFRNELNFDKFILDRNLKYRHCMLVDADDLLFPSLLEREYTVVSACDRQLLPMVSSARDCKLTILIKDIVNASISIKHEIYHCLCAKEVDSDFQILLTVSSDDLPNLQRINTEDEYYIFNMSQVCAVLHMNISARSLETYCINVLMKELHPDIYTAHQEVTTREPKLQDEIRKKEKELLAFLLHTNDILNEESFLYLDEYRRMHATLVQSLGECYSVRQRFQMTVEEYSDYTSVLLSVYEALLKLRSLNDFYLFDIGLLVHSMRVSLCEDDRKSTFLINTFRWIKQSIFLEDELPLIYSFLETYCKHIRNEEGLVALLKDLWSPGLSIIDFVRALQGAKCDRLLTSTIRESTNNTDIFDHYNIIILVTQGLDDPTSFIQSYAESRGKRLKILASCSPSEISSLDTGIQDMISNGNWVLLHNGHLIPVWFKKFESQVPISTREPKVFITWDHSTPLDKAILMRRYKFIYQSAESFQAVLCQLFSIFEHMFDNLVAFQIHLMLKSLIVHAIATCRKRYTPYGWTKSNMIDNNDLLISLSASRTFVHDFEIQKNVVDIKEELKLKEPLIYEWRQRIHDIYESKISSEIDDLIMWDILKFIDHDSFPLTIPCSDFTNWICEIPRDATQSIIGLSTSTEVPMLHSQITKLMHFLDASDVAGNRTKEQNNSPVNEYSDIFAGMEPLLSTEITRQFLESSMEYSPLLVKTECMKLAHITRNRIKLNLTILKNPHQLLDTLRLFVAYSNGLNYETLELCATPITEVDAESIDECSLKQFCNCYGTKQQLIITHLELVGAIYNFDDYSLVIPEGGSTEARQQFPIHIQWLHHTCEVTRNKVLLPVYNSHRKLSYTLTFNIRSCSEFIHLKSVRLEGLID